MRLYIILFFILSSFAWAGSGTATPTPAPTIYRSPDGVFESAVPDGWSVPTPDQEMNTTPDRYRISYIENGIVKGYFQMFFQPYAYASLTSPDLPTDLKAALVAAYKDYSYTSEISESKVGTRDGYKITFSLDDSDSELRFVQVTPDLVAEVEYMVPKGSSEQFAAAHDLLFANIKISPENIQTPTPAPTATVPVLSSEFTTLTNPKTLHALNGVLELQVPAGWTVNDEPKIMRLSMTIEDAGLSYGFLQFEVANIGALDRTGQETDLKKAFQSYLDLMSGGGYGGFGEVSESQAAGQVAYVASMSVPQSDSSGEIRVMDIGNGSILVIVFVTKPGLMPQLRPVYETILDQLVIHPENIVTPTPVPPTATVPILTSEFTDLTNGQSVHALNDVIELTLPLGWTSREQGSNLLVGISDTIIYGELSLQLTNVSLLAPSVQNSDLEKVLQSYIDYLSSTGFATFGDISETQVAGYLAYQVSLNSVKSRESSGAVHLVDLGNGNILIITFVISPQLMPQLMPVYEAILDQIVIHPENIVMPTVVTPIPIR